MSHLSLRENSYRRKHLSCVRHITLDPTGPGGGGREWCAFI